MADPGEAARCEPEFIEARPPDAEGLHALAVSIWRACYPGIIPDGQIGYMLDRMYAPEAIRGEMARGTVWKRVRVDGIDVGYLSWSRDPEGNGLELHKVYLEPEWHGLGLGRRMLEHVREIALCSGAREIRLRVNRGNHRALRAYRAAGYQVTGECIEDIGGGFVMDDYRMRLPVAATGREPPGEPAREA